MTELSTLFAASTVVLWSLFDFHTPYRVSDIRYAAPRGRYVLALAVYATTALFFFVLFSVVLIVTNFEADESLAFGLTGAVFLTIVAPRVWGIRRIADALRKAAQTLARFPQAVETWGALIARSPFRVHPEARAELMRELARYGVTPEIARAAFSDGPKVLSPAAGRVLLEICSIHLNLAERQKVGSFARFLARRGNIDDLEKEYRKLLRRAARAILLSEDIISSEQASMELAIAISDFIAEEATPLLAKYRELLAGAALSTVTGIVARRDLIREFGYDVGLPKTVPFAPVLFIFILDFLVSIAPMLFVPFPNGQTLKFYEFAMLASFHACALTSAVFWVIYPKAVTNFARPSLFHLPWQSYVIFGAVSYLFGSVGMSLAFNLIQVPDRFLAHKYPVVASMLFATIFLVTTVALSVLLDFRLRMSSCDYRRHRIRDGAVMTLTLAATTAVWQAAILLLSLVLDFTPVEIGPGDRLLLTGLYAGLGFAIGYLIPSTAEAYLKESKIRFSGLGQQSGWIGGQPYAQLASR
jgi:hypothetical protein